MLVTGWQLSRNSLVTAKHLTSLSISTVLKNRNLRLIKLIQGSSKSGFIAITSSGVDDWC